MVFVIHPSKSVTHGKTGFIHASAPGLSANRQVTGTRLPSDCNKVVTWHIEPK